MPTIDIDQDAAREAARRELAKPLYPSESPTQRVMEWAERLLRRLLAHGATLPGGWFTVSVLLIVVLAAVVFAVRLARRTLRTHPAGDYQLFGLAELSAAEHRATAQGCAGAGDWAAAIRHRLRAVARHLEETGVLDPAPGRTANELARAAGAALAALAGELSRAADAFNDVTYGEQPGTEAGYRVIADLDDHLRSRSPTEPPVPLPPAADRWVQVR